MADNTFSKLRTLITNCNNKNNNSLFFVRISCDSKVDKNNSFVGGNNTSDIDGKGYSKDFLE